MLAQLLNSLIEADRTISASPAAIPSALNAPCNDAATTREPGSGTSCGIE